MRIKAIMAELDFIERMQIPIIQGGMGLRISSPHLARTVSKRGALGLVSSVGQDLVLIRELQNGDLSGEIRQVLEDYPNQKFVEHLMSKYFIEGGKDPDAKYALRKSVRGFEQDGKKLSIPSDLEELVIAGTYAEVKRAQLDPNNLSKQHDKPVGINFLHKIQWPLLPGLYGAMLAGADALFIGAGFPKGVGEALDNMARGEPASMPVEVIDGKDYEFTFTPPHGEVKRSSFMGIISLHAGVRGIADADGYIIEGPIAGGHNPPARTPGLTDDGEPLYNEKDEINLPALHKVLERGLDNLEDKKPFYLAGSYAHRLAEALDIGAAGIQVGTPFGYCQDSGMDPELRSRALEYIANGGIVKTNPLVSPTGYPFKVLQMGGTMAIKEVYQSRRRICDLNYLISLVEKDGEVITRCPSEPERNYVKKGGNEADTVSRGCICNNLGATAGLGTPGEPPILTAGKDLSHTKKLGTNYSANDVIDYILKKADLSSLGN